MYNLSNTKLQLLVVSWHSNWLVAKTLWTVSTNCLTDSLYCTVQDLKYAPVASIIGWQFWEPDWVSADDLWWDYQLWCSWQFGRCLFGTVHGTSLKNLWQWRQNPQKGDSTNSATIHQTSQTYVITRKQLVLCNNLPTWVDFGKNWYRENMKNISAQHQSKSPSLPPNLEPIW